MLPQRLTRTITRPGSDGPAQRRGWAFRTVHAFHLPDYRTDPRPAAAGGLAGGAVQAALWLLVPLLLYRSPPGDLATVLAYGREYQVGTYLGPPLAFWLADIAFRAAGNHIFGVYLLAQLCSIAMFWTLVSAGARHRRRTTGGARGAADHDGHGVQFARAPVRPAGAGAAAVGAAAAAFLATDRPEPAQRMVRMVDRSRAVAADHLRRDRSCCSWSPDLRSRPSADGAR